MAVLEGRRILLALSGGIACYKVAELLRRLKEQGAEVRVLMTSSASAFISPLTMQALSGEPVHTQLLDPSAEMGMGHIELARWAEYLLVAPATAHTLARLAHGLADDLVATVWLATSAVRLVAPSMNQQMWLQAATQRNISLLRLDAVHILGPDTGMQACGDIGPGRMLEPLQLLSALESLVLEQPLDAVPNLQNVSVVLTAGPTRERLDPVRYISNYSSGKMGYALAEAFVRCGAQVTMVSGPVALSPPSGVRVLAVESAEEMWQATQSVLAGCHIFVGTAAVADYRPKNISAQKIKKNNEVHILELEKTVDILAEVAKKVNRPFVVGFAAETESVAIYAQDKLQRKNLDMIACNDVSQPGIGFASDDNALQLFWRGGGLTLAKTSKLILARQLVGVIGQRWQESRA